MMLIAAIDTSYDPDSRILLVGILIGSYNSIQSIHKEISQKIRRSYLHFREMSRREKNVALDVLRKYAGKIRLIVILIKERKLSMNKRLKIAKFIETLLRGAGVSHVYVCTDLDRKSFILSKSIKLNATVSRGDNSIPVQIADVAVNYYRRKNEGMNVSVKVHNC